MRNLTKGNEAKHIVMFALPMLLGNFLQSLYNVVDSFYVGNYIGKEALAGVSVGGPILFMFISFIMGTTMGSTILIAQYYGAKDMDNVKKSINTAFFFLAFASIIVTILGMSFSKSILIWMNTPPDVLKDADTYLKIIFAGIIFMFGYNSLSAILRGLGDSVTPLYFLLITTIVNAILDPIFIFFFHMGVSGVAYATVIAQAISVVLSAIYLNKKNDIVKIKIRDIRFNKRIFLLTIKIGIPMGLQQTLVSIAMVSLNKIINNFGTNAMAAYGAAGKIDAFMIMPIMSLAMSASTFTGQNLGAGFEDRVKRGYIASMIIGTLVTGTISLIVYILRYQFIGLFNKDPMVIEFGAGYFYILAGFYIVFSFMFITNGVVRGSGDTIPPLLTTLTSLWFIRVPLASFLSKRWGINGVWWSIAIGWIVGFLLSYAYYRTGRWKNKIAIKKGPIQEI